MDRIAELKKAIDKPIHPDALAKRYREMRKRHALLSMREHKTVTGQGCSDTYPGGYPL